MSTSLRSEVLPIDDVRPYWRNPRKITETAVAGVQVSLEEFGYVQPIVVDAEGVIVIGHTRYTAMRRAGVEEVEVLRIDLSPAKAKALRVIDNKTHEYAWWDHEKLWEELKATAGGSDVMAALFPEAVAPSDDGAPDAAAEPPVDPQGPYPVDFVCPSCFHEWSMDVTREQVLSGWIDPTVKEDKDAAA